MYKQSKYQLMNGKASIYRVYKHENIIWPSKKWSIDTGRASVNLENIVLSERIQTQDVPYSIISFLWVVQNRPTGLERRLIRGGWRHKKGRTEEWLFKIMEFLLRVRKIFCNSRWSVYNFMTIQKTLNYTDSRGDLYGLWIILQKKHLSKRNLPLFHLLWMMELNKTRNSLDYVVDACEPALPYLFIYLYFFDFDPFKLLGIGIPLHVS